ncbi:MAG: helix-turn-helix transcriptional regulator [Pseudomonadota bacterium]
MNDNDDGSAHAYVIDQHVGYRMRFARERMQLKPEFAANVLGISLSELLDIEAGLKRTSPELFLKFAELYDRSAGWFFVGLTESASGESSNEDSTVIDFAQARFAKKGNNRH